VFVEVTPVLVKVAMEFQTVERNLMSVVFVMEIVPLAMDVTEFSDLERLWTFVVFVVETMLVDAQLPALDAMEL